MITGTKSRRGVMPVGRLNRKEFDYYAGNGGGANNEYHHSSLDMYSYKLGMFEEELNRRNPQGPLQFPGRNIIDELMEDLNTGD